MPTAAGSARSSTATSAAAPAISASSTRSSGRKIALNPPGVAKPIRGYYSNSVRVAAGPLLFIAGQVALDAEGRVVGKGDVRAQTVQVLENMRAILGAHGADV